jgi:hypothetical protein
LSVLKLFWTGAKTYLGVCCWGNKVSALCQ